MDNHKPKNCYLPNMRISAQLHERLKSVAERSVSHRLTDHVRFALERYVEAEEAAQTPASTATQR